MYHVVSLSGGLCSFFTAMRAAERYGTDRLVTIFADTRIEHPDLYRFLDETVPIIGGEHIRLDQGMDVWDVFFKERFLGNSRIDVCSKNLKREPLRKYIQGRFSPEETVLHFGFDVEEIGRFERCAELWKPYRSEAVLQSRPFMTRPMMEARLAEMGIRLPELYSLGFPHNNCGGFCVKAGQKQFKLLHDKAYDVFAYHRDKEQEFQEFIGKEVTILRKQRDGVKHLYSLAELEADIKAERDETDDDDWNGCQNCFSPEQITFNFGGK